MRRTEIFSRRPVPNSGKEKSPLKFQRTAYRQSAELDFFVNIRVSDIRILPDSHNLLHHETHSGYRNPAAEPRHNRFAAALNEIYNICVESNRRHGDHYAEFAEGLERRKEFFRRSQSPRRRRYLFLFTTG